MNFETLWVEKYRPKTLNDLVLAPDIKEFFENINKAETKAIPHLLLVGPAGGGKTSLAKVIVNDILKCENLYINASDENGIDVVRNKITNFITTRSFDGGMKVVILDEADGLSGVGGSGSSAQQCLRNILEEYSAYSRFILTANYTHKIIEPIVSRVQTFYIQPELKDYMKRCLTILKSENISVTAEHKQALMELIQSSYPDLRKVIGEMQRLSASNVFKPSENNDKELRKVGEKCYCLLIGKMRDSMEIRKLVIESEQEFKSNYNLLLKVLFDEFYKSEVIDINKKRNILLIIAEAMKDDMIVMDKEINYFATLIKIEKVI